jgi:hypothetical protein
MNIVAFSLMVFVCQCYSVVQTYHKKNYFVAVEIIKRNTLKQNKSQEVFYVHSVCTPVISQFVVAN